jgi:hypothetical protein
MPSPKIVQVQDWDAIAKKLHSFYDSETLRRTSIY